MEADKLVKLFQAEFELCKVAPTQNAIVLSSDKSREGYAAAALQALLNIGAKAFELRTVTPPGRKEGSVGNTPVAGNRVALEALKAADFVVDLVFLLHSPEQAEVLAAGTRILLVIEPPSVLMRQLPTEELRLSVKRGAAKLRNARQLRVTSEAGTDLYMKIGDYPVIEQYGFTDEPGRWDHFPSAFFYTWPNEGDTHGRVVLNKGDLVWPLNKYLDTPVTLTVEGGYIRKIEGGLDAEMLRDAFESFNDPEAYAVAHMGWGVDPRSKFDALLSEPSSVGNDARSFAGNVQFSTGPNLEVGGTRATLGHFDMPMLECTLLLDDQPVVINGQVVEN